MKKLMKHLVLAMAVMVITPGAMVMARGMGGGFGSGSGTGTCIGTGGGAGSGYGGGSGGGQFMDGSGMAALINALPSEPVSGEESSALAFMVQEEKLARDVYTALYTEWGLPIFRNIAASEQHHMDAVAALMEKYGLPLSDDDTAGVFSNSDLQNLYGGLIAQGMVSVEAALEVGATIEDLDISDLQSDLDDPAIDNQDIRLVFQNLAKGSRNHLRSFDRMLGLYGITYTPQYLSVEEYTAIMETHRERGLMDADGNRAGAALMEQYGCNAAW